MCVVVCGQLTNLPTPRLPPSLLSSYPTQDPALTLAATTHRPLQNILLLPPAQPAHRRHQAQTAPATWRTSSLLHMLQSFLLVLVSQERTPRWSLCTPADPGGPLPTVSYPCLVRGAMMIGTPARPRPTRAGIVRALGVSAVVFCCCHGQSSLPSMNLLLVPGPLRA